MDNAKNNEYYLAKIIADMSFIEKHAGKKSIEELKADEILLDSVMFRLIQISENSLKLTEGFKERYAEIPWRAVKGLRNRIVHEYGNVDVKIIYDTIVFDLPPVLKTLNEILNS